MAEPVTTCVDSWAKASLLVKESVGAKEKLLAKLLDGPSLSQSDSDDPLVVGGTAYTACIFGDADELATSALVMTAGKMSVLSAIATRTGTLPPMASVP